MFLTDCAHMICKFPFDRSNSFPFDWSNGNELTQYSAYKLYPFLPSFLIIDLAGYLTNAWMVGSSFFMFFLVNIAEFLWVVRAGEIIWEMKIEEFPLMRLFLIISVMLQSLNLAIIAGTFINFVSLDLQALSILDVIYSSWYCGINFLSSLAKINLVSSQDYFSLWSIFLKINVFLIPLFLVSSNSFVSIFISSLSSSKKKRRFCDIFVLATFNSCVSWDFLTYFQKFIFKT